MGNTTEVVICGFARTPIGKYRGALRNYSAIELGIMSVKELLSRTKINPESGLVDELISINREDKMNFLNFIYRTEDNYVIASSDKNLIKNSINSSYHFKEKKFEYEGELSGLKNEKNLLFTKKFPESIFFNKEIFTENNEDIIATTFDFKNKHLILKSYLLNNKKILIF